MSTQTTNYGFTKPTADEFYDIEVQNGNWDKADTKFKELDSSLSENTQVNKKFYQQSELLNGWVNNADMPYVFKYGKVITIAIRSLTGTDVTKPVFELPSFCGANLNTYSKSNGIYVLSGFVYLTEINSSERTLTFIDYR